MKRILVLISAILFFALLGGLFYFYGQYLGTPMTKNSDPQVFEVSSGSSLSKVSQKLEEMGFIRNARVLSLYGRLTGSADRLKVGEYEINRNQSAIEILKTLMSGKSIGRLFTVTEGLNLFEISEQYEQQGFGSKDEFIRMAFDPAVVQELLGESAPSLEGYLFPETYSLTKFTSTKELLKKMVSAFQDVYEVTVGDNAPAGWTKNQVVTLASIIEKETGAPQERPIISSVFHNRLNKGMRLQTDPTVLYGLALENKKVILKISKEDLQTPRPYNTYTIPGLPPGPIANPGADALAAAIEPEQTEFLFFVSQNDGTHVFSETYEKHAAAVRKFQMDPAARRGKSWRDLNK